MTTATEEPMPENGNCADCGFALKGSHCHNCGQAAGSERSLSALWHEASHAILHVDGKLRATLRQLAFSPGRLTRDYIAGQRTRHVGPLGLFLFSVFVLFAVLQLTGNPIGKLTQEQSINPALTQAELALGRMLAGDIPEKAETPGILYSDTRDAARANLSREERRERAGSAVFFVQQARAAWNTDSGRVADIEEIDPEATGGEAIAQQALANPALLFAKAQSNSYKYSWLLIPLSMPLMLLLFFRRKDTTAYDHAVFVTYSIAFSTLLLSVAIVPIALGVAAPAALGIALVAATVHHAVHLRGAYRLSVAGTTWRLVVMEAYITVLLFAATLALFTLGASG